jgi:hemerythrin-like domain-containing protein
MKRHPSLAILSREHHGALILAQLLKKGAPVYKGLPADLDSKADYAIRFYRDKLIKHFAEEEQSVIKKTKGINIDLDKLGSELIEEHIRLTSSFESIKTASDLATHLDKLGSALQKHIRKEEREFFPLIQELCGEKLLSEIEQALSAKN